MRNRITEWIASRFGSAVQVDERGQIRYHLTGRGAAKVNEWLARQGPTIQRLDPIRKMVKTEGWAIFEADIRQEILQLWTEAIEDMASDDPVKREGAYWKCVIGRALNKRVLEAVNGKALNVTMIEQSIHDFKQYSNDYATLTGSNGNE